MIKSTNLSKVRKEKKRDPTMVHWRSQGLKQILAVSAALNSWLSPKAILGLDFSFSLTPNIREVQNIKKIKNIFLKRY